MGANSSTGSAAPSVQKWVIDSDVEYQLRSLALKARLQDKGLSQGSIELYLRYPNLASIGWGEQQPFSSCTSLLRVNLSGCPKLESIPRQTFGGCTYLVSVVFGEHNIITNLARCAFEVCLALKSITLPDKLKVIEQLAFNDCTSLERVVCNKDLKTIGDCTFQHCAKLEDV